MCLFSAVCLVWVGLFPSVARRNFGMDVDDTGYKLLYTTWGVGACLGALAVGTVLAPSTAGGWRRRPRPVRREPGRLRHRPRPGPAYPVAFVLGFAYFLTATALITIFQENLADTERAATMPLWFMAFGGSVPIGNLVFGPVIDAIGARWVLGLGAVVAVGLARWCDLRRLPRAPTCRPASPTRRPPPVAADGIVAGR